MINNWKVEVLSSLSCTILLGFHFLQHIRYFYLVLVTSCFGSFIYVVRYFRLEICIGSSMTCYINLGYVNTYIDTQILYECVHIDNRCQLKFEIIDVNRL